MGIATGMIVGAVIGFGALNVMALMARNSGRPYDQTTLTTDEDVLGKVASWAQANGYFLERETGQTQVYRKGKGFLTAPMFLEVIRDGSRHTFRSYTRINGLIIKGDMALSGSSFVASLPRSMARKAQNQLFAELHAPPIG
ncbi:hypothetical protein [Stenotrophomonas sp. SY1]|uniref:hypothetical protein n=1 Tax=Stenotrophomonas sp. SY1 TaxID=477235 RepID=UPI001E4B0BD4|nr:hypothetical protein [Stenotrophomonas sp. SY1]MCD9088401.1 hypothetical protein [Stenotrophomonas sp. SY1]